MTILVREQSIGARRLAAALLTSTALCGSLHAQNAAIALPDGGRFVAGQGEIGTPQDNKLTITQSSDRAVIDWQTFSIGQGGTVDFQNGSGATLNRIIGGDLTRIMGTLRATGSVYLVNPQGVVVGEAGLITTGGSFVASTLNIGNDAFMKGGVLRFKADDGAADVEVRNLGRITATGGDVLLISRSVKNESAVTAPKGAVGLAAGAEVLIRESGDGQQGLVRVAGASGDVINLGTLDAVQAELRAAGGNVFALAGNNGELVRATGVEVRGGRVWLTAPAGTVTINTEVSARDADGSGGAVEVEAQKITHQGSISVAGSAGAGGRVVLLGNDIELTGARIDASGETGGGYVRVGGGRLGGEGLPEADLLSADKLTTILADARQSGDGGDVVLWSRKSTVFPGFISARGGAASGNGGEVEVSSRGYLAYTGRTDLRPVAATGAFGNLLLDPYNIIISNGSSTAIKSANGFTVNQNDSIINVTDHARPLHRLGERQRQCRPDGRADLRQGGAIGSDRHLRRAAGRVWRWRGSSASFCVIMPRSFGLTRSGAWTWWTIKGSSCSSCRSWSATRQPRCIWTRPVSRLCRA